MPSTTTAIRQPKFKQLFLLAVFATSTITMVATAIPAHAAENIQQCNDSNNVGGEAIECNVTVTNTVNLDTNVASSVVVIENCVGEAGAALTCITETRNFQEATVTVDQCNGSGNGGGGTVTCRVDFINNITGTTVTSPATVNQCNGSGGDGGTQPTLICDPTGSTTNATVDQCNGSGNGGGGTERVLCTVEASTETSALPVTVNQCNGSANGGGALVICATSLINNVVDSPTEEEPTVPGDGGTTPPTDGGTTPGTDDGGTTPPVDESTPPTGGETPSDEVVPPTNDSETPVDNSFGNANDYGQEGDSDAKVLASTGSETYPYLIAASAAMFLGVGLLAVSKKKQLF